MAFFETSARDGAAVDDAFRAVARDVKRRLAEQPVPAPRRLVIVVRLPPAPQHPRPPSRPFITCHPPYPAPTPISKSLHAYRIAWTPRTSGPARQDGSASSASRPDSRFRDPAVLLTPSRNRTQEPTKPGHSTCC